MKGKQFIMKALIPLIGLFFLNQTHSAATVEEESFWKKLCCFRRNISHSPDSTSSDSSSSSLKNLSSLPEDASRATPSPDGQSSKNPRSTLRRPEDEATLEKTDLPEGDNLRSTVRRSQGEESLYGGFHNSTAVYENAERNDLAALFNVDLPSDLEFGYAPVTDECQTGEEDLKGMTGGISDA